MKHSYTLLVLFLACCFPSSVGAQQGSQSVYYHLSYRSVPIENDAAFMQYISDIIKPMFVEEVDIGRLSGWFVYRTRYVSSEETYNYIFSRAANDLENLEEAFDGGFEAAVGRVHGNNLDQINARSQGLSKVVKSELWELNSISVLQTNAPPARWANVRFFRNNSQRDITRDMLLQNVVAQFQLARIDRGVSSGWGYFIRRLPYDNPGSYDTAEINYYDDFDQILGAGIGQEIWEEIRTDTSILNDNMDRLLETRTFVKRELWEMVDYVQ